MHRAPTMSYIGQIIHKRRRRRRKEMEGGMETRKEKGKGKGEGKGREGNYVNKTFHIRTWK